MLNISNLSGGDEFLLPNVSLVTDTNSLFYNPLIQEEEELPYLTITALEDDLTVSFTNSCQYSLNGTDWNELSANTTTPAINTGDKIYFKAEGLTPDRRSGIGTFAVSKKFNLSGNVMSMHFGDNAGNVTNLDGAGLKYAFSFLFQNCTGLERVSKDFLPATTLAEGCYGTMFSDCTSLVQAPELPATTLATMCYNGMFQGCTSLVQAPELPANMLTIRCYAYMFTNCTSLNYIKMLATDISGVTGCLDSWVSNVSPTGTFVKSKDATWNVTGNSGIPEGWTVETV